MGTKISTDIEWHWEIFLSGSLDNERCFHMLFRLWRKVNLLLYQLLNEKTMITSAALFFLFFSYIFILFELIQEFQISSIVFSISLIIINNNNDNNSNYYYYCYYTFQQTREIYIDTSKERQKSKRISVTSRQECDCTLAM